MSQDKSGWGQVAVGVLSLVILLGGAWVAMSSGQAETRVRISKLEEKVKDGYDYDVSLQEQVSNNEERIIIAETTLKFLKENSDEMNENIKVLVTEIQKLNVNMAGMQANKED